MLLIYINVLAHHFVLYVCFICTMRAGNHFEHKNSICISLNAYNDLKQYMYLKNNHYMCLYDVRW